MKKMFLILLVVLAALFLASCDEEGPKPGPEETGNAVVIYECGNYTLPYNPTQYTGYLIYDTVTDDYHFIYESVASYAGPTTYNYSEASLTSGGSNTGRCFNTDFATISAQTIADKGYRLGLKDGTYSHYYGGEPVSGTQITEGCLVVDCQFGTFFIIDNSVYVISKSQYASGTGTSAAVEVTSTTNGTLVNRDFTAYYDGGSKDCNYILVAPEIGTFYFNEAAPV